MLTITRSLYQTFKIGDEVTVKILGFAEWREGDQKIPLVRIGIEAPQHIRIERDDMKNRPARNKSVGGNFAPAPSAPANAVSIPAKNGGCSGH